MNNKVFSGGIDARWVSVFSPETQQQLQWLGQAKVEEARLSPDDKLLKEIMTPGLNADVDKLIEVLQVCLEHPS